MELLEEQQREEMELAALQEEQENEEVRRQQRQSFICIFFFTLENSSFLFALIRVNFLKTSESKLNRSKVSFLLIDLL